MLNSKLLKVVICITFMIGVAPLQSVYGYQKRIALLIGAELYEGGAGEGIFRNLPFFNDLNALQVELRKVGFDTVTVYSDTENVEYIDSYKPINFDPSSSVSVSDVDKVIERQLSAIEDKDDTLFLLYLTGHGGAFTGPYGANDRPDRVLAFPNSELDLPGSFMRVQGILEKMAISAPSVDKILVIDACADIIGPGSGFSATMSAEHLPYHLYSSTLEEKSYFDSELGISVFTHHFIKALTEADTTVYGEPPDGKIDTGEIFQYVNRWVPNHDGAKKQKKLISQDEKFQQTPWGSGSQSIVVVNKHWVRKANESEIKYEARTEGYKISNYD